MRIFLPAGVFLLLCVLYSFYWLWASERMEAMVIGWADEQRAAGTEVSWSSLEVTGYPFRLEAHIGDPVIRARDWSWQGERFVLHMLPYNFRHYIGVFRGRQAVSLGGPAAGRPLFLEGAAERARASLVLEQAGGLRLSVDLTGLAARQLGAAQGPVTARFAAEHLQIHLRQWIEGETNGNPNAKLAFAVQAEKAELPAHGLKGLGSVIDLARGQILLNELPLVAGADPLSLADWLRAWQSNGGGARLQGLDLRWDEIDLSASGRMALDGSGRPSGEIDTIVAGHAEIIEVLAANRLLPGEQAETAKNALAALNLVSRDERGRLLMPVTLKKGNLYLGPVKLGELAPVY